MPEASLDNSCAQTNDSPSRRRRKDMLESSKPVSLVTSKLTSPSKTPPITSSPLVCELLNLSAKQRVLASFLGFMLVIPYVSLSLTHPEWTGHIGSRLSLGLFSLLGQAALFIPLLLVYLALSVSGLRALRQTRLAYLLPLMLTITLFFERMSHSGGWLGRVLDSVLLTTVGPGGAWLIAVSALMLFSLAFLPNSWQYLFGGLTAFLSKVQELRSTLTQAWNQRFTPASEPTWERLFPPATDCTTQDPTPGLLPVMASNAVDHKPDFASPSFLAQPMSGFPLEVVSFESATDANSFNFTDQLGHLENREDSPLNLLSHPHLTATSQDDDDPSSNDTPLTMPTTHLEHNEPKQVAPTSLAVNQISPNQVSPQAGALVSHPDDPRSAIPRAKPFELPPLALLDDAATTTPRRRLEDKSQALLDALDAFGVKAKLSQIVRGPTVTRYELLPARGVKVSKFTSLTNDIALALASTAVRIEAPIPGKSAIGIEIPNEVTDLVVLKDILRDTAFSDSKGLTVALGKDLTGRPVVTDLQKMPHLLVAGTTGSGKSVCVNGLIISLLYRFTPDQLQLMMVDPKQVELSIYEDIPHLVGFSEGGTGEIIVEPKKAAQALHQVVELMEQRYTLFAENRVRNLAEYNAKATPPLPWFVVIIDELADLMMIASKSVETSICRIAQKARAAGIHLVLATQRPSADVITGLIKVNIPSRIAFAVSSQVDSRVILDSGGAENLLGKGDMLFLPVEASDPRRLQGAYVTNDEISRIVEFWKGQALPANRIEFELKDDPLAIEESDTDTNSDDALLEEALNVILQRDQASASMLQTDLKVGYARARRLLMAMEKKGWVSPAEGSKPRKILYSGSLAHGAPSPPSDLTHDVP